MGKAQDTDIYKETYGLLQQVLKLTRSFSRDFRHILARDMVSRAQGLTILIFEANCAIGRAKTPFIEQIRVELSVLQLQVRLSKDLQQISPGQQGDTVAMLDSVGKQATGWLNFARKSA